MNIKHIRKLPFTLGFVALLLSGCASYGNLDGAYEPEAFGEANRLTYAAMIVDPEPEYTSEIEADAEKSNAAIERYRNDAVKEPDSVSSTSVAGGGGSGGI